MIGLEGGGLDPQFDRARHLLGEIRASLAPVFATLAPIFSAWGTYSPEVKAHNVGKWCELVGPLSKIEAVLWMECPHLPPEIRAILEEVCS